MLPHWGSLPDPPPAVSGSSFCPMTIIIFLYYSCLLTCLPSVASFWGHGLWFLCICNVWHLCMRSCLLLLIHSLLYIVFITHNELNKTLATSCESALPFLKQGHTFSHRGGSNGSGGKMLGVIGVGGRISIAHGMKVNQAWPWEAGEVKGQGRARQVPPVEMDPRGHGSQLGRINFISNT